MNSNHKKLAVSALSLAVQGALLAMTALSAQAQEATVAELTNPENYVEFGALNVTNMSPKFGEYNGLNDSGAKANASFSVKGGDSYGQGTGLNRWSVTGTNLGLDNRELNATVAKQGQWSVGIGYDELRHNTTTGYQTPYQGLGGNNLTLPASFTTVGSPILTTTGNLTPADYALFRTYDVDNTRKNTSVKASYAFNPEFRVSFDYNNLEQSGAKLMAFGLNGYNGTSGEKVTILPNPTDYATDTFNLALSWTGEKAHLTGAYFGSFFRDHNDRITVQSWNSGASNNVFSTAPSNNFNQFNLSGGYKYSPTTNLVGGLSYGRNTQDTNFVASGLEIGTIPKTSLGGVVVTTHGDLKVTNQTTQDLKLSAGVKYDKRSNDTTSSIYNFNAIGWTGLSTTTNNPALYPNAPYSYSKTQYEIAGDYRLSSAQKLRLSYNREDVKRWCNDYAINAGYPAGTDCLTDPKTTEDKFSVNYKLKASESVNVNAAYVYSDRTTDYDPNARVAMISVRGGTTLSDATQGTIKGLNGGDYQGFHPIFDASRHQNAVKAGVNWDANDKWTVGLNGRYAEDKYTDDTFGAQNGRTWNVNLDLNFNYSDSGSLFGYISKDYRDRYITHVNRSNTTSSAYQWGDLLEDGSTTIGLGFKQSGLVGGKLDLKGDLTYSDAVSNYASAVIYTYSGGTVTPTYCANVARLTCGPTPDITNRLTQIKLTGNYKVDQQRKVTVGVLFQKFASTDYFYNGYQYGLTPSAILPTNQQSGTYYDDVVFANFTYSFR